MPRRPRANRRRLFETAARQAGYFTARQAHEAGYSTWSLYHHVKTGTFERVAHGFYRLPEFPASSFEDVIAAWLKAGSDRAVVSHETALLLHELSSIKPRKVHLTVPREARRRRAGPLLPAVQIHTTTVPFQPRETIWRQGARVTAPARTIADVAEAGTDPSHVIEAVTQALHRGLVTPRELRHAAARRSARVRQLIQRAIEEAGHAA
jgi:predicted transcriptional regulator of viral defense system